MDNPNHTTIDIKNVNEEYLTNEKLLNNYLRKVVKHLNLKALNNVFTIAFPTENNTMAYTMALGLTTSLISLHTYPEKNSIYIDLFACSDYDRLNFLHFTQTYFNSNDSYLNTISRMKI